MIEEALDIASCLLGCTRPSLNVVEPTASAMVGSLRLRHENGKVIDCTKMGVGGMRLPASIDRVWGMSSGAFFILLVGSYAAFTRLAEDRFYVRYPCIIITAKGQPDVPTKLFLKKIHNELKLPVLALVDIYDPNWMNVLSIYGFETENTPYASSNLITPDIKWLGMRPSDLDKYNIPEEHRLPMTEQDIKMARDLLKEDFVKKNQGWVDELNLMLKTKQKAEIQALSAFGFHYLSYVYLPRKLQQQDWL